MLSTTLTPSSGYVWRVAVPAQRAGRAVDRRGYYRSPVTLADYHVGREPANKGRRFPPEPLTPAQVAALLEACSRGSAGKRDRALIALLWRTGLRIGEALALAPKDVQLDDGYLRVLHGKGDRDRTVAIDQIGAAFMAPWLACRRELGLGSREPVFCVISRPTIGKPMHAAQVRNLLKDLAVKAGIEQRVHPHGLRHTHAFELAGERADLREIQAQLGHTSLATTARYIDHLNPADRIAHLRARPAPQGFALPHDG